MANDPNRYGNPPASKTVVKSLEKIQINSINADEIIKNKEQNNCSVCKDDFELDNIVIRIPCSHVYHEDCILPWLKERNSCPTCRFELPTDDEDYEQRKNDKRNIPRNENNNNNS